MFVEESQASALILNTFEDLEASALLLVFQRWCVYNIKCINLRKKLFWKNDKNALLVFMKKKKLSLKKKGNKKHIFFLSISNTLLISFYFYIVFYLSIVPSTCNIRDINLRNKTKRRLFRERLSKKTLFFKEKLPIFLLLIFSYFRNIYVSYFPFIDIAFHCSLIYFHISFYNLFFGKTLFTTPDLLSSF